VQNHRHAEQGRVSTAERAQPLLGQRAPEIQPYGTLSRYPLALAEPVWAASVEALNQLLADTMTLRDLYKKHHWQVAGHTFYQPHLLFDKHYSEQSTLVDALAERIQSLGGISVAVPHDVAEMTRLERPLRGAKRCRYSSRGCWKHTSASCGRPERRRRRGPTPAMTGPMTSWSAASSAPMRCRSGSWPNTWSIPLWCGLSSALPAP
jgi:Ferritin-like domain